MPSSSSNAVRNEVAAPEVLRVVVGDARPVGLEFVDREPRHRDPFEPVVVGGPEEERRPSPRPVSAASVAVGEIITMPSSARATPGPCSTEAAQPGPIDPHQVIRVRAEGLVLVRGVVAAPLRCTHHLNGVTEELTGHAVEGAVEEVDRQLHAALGVAPRP